MSLSNVAPVSDTEGCVTKPHHVLQKKILRLTATKHVTRPHKMCYKADDICHKSGEMYHRAIYIYHIYALRATRPYCVKGSQAYLKRHLMC